MDVNNPTYTLKDLEDDLCDPMSAQRSTLQNILTSLQSVSFLKKRGIGPHTTLEEFVEMHPITTYDDYESLVNAVADGDSAPSHLIGDEEDNDDDALLGFFLTSGTSRGRNKLIPKMKRDLALRFSLFNLLTEVLAKEGLPGGFSDGQCLTTAQKGMIIQTKSGLPAGGATSLNYADPKMHPMLQKFMLSPVNLVLLDSAHQIVTYAHLLIGLTRREEVNRVSNNYSNETLELFILLEENCNILVSHLRHGVHATVEGLVDQESLEILQPIIGDGHPDLADFVQTECRKGFDGILIRLFPNCKYVSSITSGTMLPYAKKLKKYTGAIPIVSSLYGASEGFLGLNMDPLQKQSDVPLYTILPRSTSFFEFQPFPNENNLAPVTLDKVEIGGIYEVIVTSYNSLFRYRLGDVVRVVKFKAKTPVVEFFHRSNAVLSLSHEFMTERHLINSVFHIQKKCGIRVRDYVFDANTSCVPPHYLMYYEAEAGADGKPNVSAALDKALEDENSYYKVKRSGNRLGEASAVEVRKGTFGEYKALMVTGGADPGQFKTPRVVNNERLRAILIKSSNHGVSVEREVGVDEKMESTQLNQ